MNLHIPYQWRGPIFLGGVAAVVLGIVAVLSLMRYSSGNPSFCLNCHAQGPVPLAVSDKGHTGIVPCIACHARARFPIAQGFPRSFSADPEDVNTKCRGCHKEVGPGEPRVMRANVRDISIPHKLHVGTMNVPCVQCHANVAHDDRPTPTNRPSMQICSSCHNTQENCQTCHRRGPSAMAPAAGKKKAG